LASKKVRIISNYKRVFSEGAGREVLLDLMHKFHMMNSTFDPDNRESARMQGEQNVILFILSRMDVDTEELLKEIEAAKAQARMEE
jgi:hypothetical protein